TSSSCAYAAGRATAIQGGSPRCAPTSGSSPCSAATSSASTSTSWPSSGSTLRAFRGGGRVGGLGHVVLAVRRAHLVGDFLRHVGLVVLRQHLLGDEHAVLHAAGRDHRLLLAEQVGKDAGVD